MISAFILLALLIVIIGIALLTSLAKTNALSHRLERLEREILRLSAAVTREAPGTQTISQVTLPSEELKVADRKPVLQEQARPETMPPSPASLIDTRQPMPPAEAAGSSRTREEWEALIGGKVLNRIGALALIMGVGFFMKYAFDNNWISETTRVLIGGLIGITLLLAGSRSHRRGLQIFAQGLVGAGISILYSSVYASFNFYHLLPQGAAFALMSIVTIITFQQAFKYDSLAVSLLGWAGGFLTPFLLSSGETNELGLFAYIALLDAGLIAVLVWKESWVVLEPLTAAATYFVYRLWHQAYYSQESFGLTLTFLVIFAVLFYLLHTIHVIRRTNSHSELRQVVSGFNAFLYYGEMYLIIDPQYHNWMGLVTLVIGLVYILSSNAITRRRPEASQVSAQYALFAIAFLVIATAIQFSGFTTVMLWALEALSLLWLGMRRRLRYLWLSGLCLFVIAGVKFLFTEGAFSYSPLQSFALLLNERALALLVFAGTIGIGAAQISKAEEQRAAVLSTVMHYAWCGALLFMITAETNDYFQLRLVIEKPSSGASIDFSRFLALAIVWVVYSLPLVWIGLRRHITPVLYSGLVILALGSCLAFVRGITFEPISAYAFLMNSRALVLTAVIIAVVVQSRWLTGMGNAYAWIKEVSGVLSVATVLLVLDLITAETRDFFQRDIFLLEQTNESTSAQQKIGTLLNTQQLALSGVWLVFSIAVMGIGIWQRMREVRIVAIILFGISTLKIFIYDLSFLEALYRIFSFIGLGVILLGTSYLYQRYKAVIFGPDSQE